MAEIAGLVIGVPGLLSTMAEVARRISADMQRFKVAELSWKQLEKICKELGDQDFVRLEALSRSMTVLSPDGRHQDHLQEMVEEVDDLKKELEKVEKLLGKLHPSNVYERLRWAFKYDKEVSQSAQRLGDRRNNLLTRVLIMQEHSKAVSAARYLSRDVFAVHEDGSWAAVPGTSMLFTAQADYCGHNQRLERGISVLIERHKTDVDGARLEYEGVAGRLSALPGEDRGRPGVLSCLGYRSVLADSGYQADCELVFSLPRHHGGLDTLYSLMARDMAMGAGYGGGRPLEHRYELAAQLCMALIGVHSLNLVHKNIRPDTILVAHHSPGTQGAGMGTAYLAHWHGARDIEAPSNLRFFPDIKAHEVFYRHPERQFIAGKNYYNVGHDIYSLGVCLLEIGLWEPLWDFGTPDFHHHPQPRGPLLLETAANPELLRPRHSDERASWVKDVITRLATTLLPPRVGAFYAQVVVACLRILDEDKTTDDDLCGFNNLSERDKVLAFRQFTSRMFSQGYATSAV